MMIHADFQAAMARERSAALIAAAAAHRRARQLKQAAGTAVPAATGAGQVVLRDGSAVLIRPVRRTDAALLADGFARLSERSRRLRFLGRKSTLTEADLRYYTDVDHHGHEAPGAVDHVRGGGVGIALVAADNAAVAGLLRNSGASLIHRGSGSPSTRST